MTTMNTANHDHTFTNEYEAANRLKKIGKQIASMKAAAEADPVAALDREQELLQLQTEQRAIAVWIKARREQEAERKVKTARAKAVTRDKTLAEIEQLLPDLESKVHAIAEFAEVYKKIRSLGETAMGANAYVERNLPSERKGLHSLAASSLERMVRQLMVQAFGAGPFLNMHGAESLECSDYRIEKATDLIRKQLGVK